MTIDITIRRILPPLLFTALFTGISASAQTPEDATVEQPPWEVCNETSFILNVATASVPVGNKNAPLSVEGWLTLRPGKCEIIPAEKGTPRFVYARSAALHQGGVREWKGAHEYCLGDKDFKAEINIDCALQNLGTAKYLRVIPTEARTTFVEPANFRSKATTAGLQRLLMENGYDIRRVDGHTGKRTSKTLNVFLKDQELERDISIDEKYGALERAAIEAQKSAGIEVCNKAKARIWSAISYPNKTGWESRGWWPIDAGQCIRPFTDSIKGKDVFVYARLEIDGAADKILSVRENQGQEFCISEAAFAAVRHEFCTDQGYVPARFKALPKDKTGTQVTFRGTDFSGAVVSGLRE